MLHTLILLRTKESHFKQVTSLLAQFIIFPTKHYFSTQVSLNIHPQLQANKTNQDLSVNLSVIANNVKLKCSHIWNTDKDYTFTNYTLKDYFLRLSSVCPETIRKFWRVSVLSPSDVYEILRCFELECEKNEVSVEKIASLWGLFKLASEQCREFVHFPISCKIMASLLVRAGLFRDVEYLFTRRECQEILVDCEGIFSSLIEWYVRGFELDKAISVYRRMKGLCLVPSLSSYRAIAKYLVELDETELMYCFYMDMVENVVVEWGRKEKEIHENVVRSLCVNRKVQEARLLVKNAMNLGVGPSDKVISSVCFGYCEKKDYYDLLSFLSEMRIVPSSVIGNSVLFSLCKNFGVEQASMFMEKLEELSFCPDEVTFGILIGSSCKEGKLKDAFGYFSEIASRNLKPHIYSYNALLSGIFKQGVWQHTRELLIEMNDMGVTPHFSTFRVLLAGFCKYRKFEEVKTVIGQMEENDLVKLSPYEDRLTKAFTLLGLDPSSVKIKRDNNKGSFKTEFFDNVGNGLYLDADIDDYEEKVAKVLDDAMIPDFSSELENLQSLDAKSILTLVDELEKWGQKLSFPALSSLLNRFCGGYCSINTIGRLLRVIFESVYCHDEKTLNMLVKIYSRKGLTFKARVVFDEMVRRGFVVEDEAYSALLNGLCKKSDLNSFKYCYKLAKESNWLPEVKDCNAMFGYMCKNKWLTEAFELLEIGPYNSFDVINTFLLQLCSQGLTSTALVLMEELLNHEYITSHMSYGYILHGFCQEKRYENAFIFLDTVFYRSIHPSLNVLVQLIPHLCRTHKFEKAVELKHICLNKLPMAMVPINSALVIGFCKSERVEEAMEIFSEILLNGLIPDNKAFNELIQALCRVKTLKSVEEVLGVMIRRNLSVSVSSFGKIARFLCSEGKLFLALRCKELMAQVTNLPELVLYNILIFHLFATQNNSAVDAVIDDIRLKGLEFDTFTYNFLVQGFSQCGKISHSLHYLNSMIEKDLKPSNRSFRNVISYLCCKNEIGKAMNLSRIMESRGWIHDSVIQSKIVELLFGNNRLHQAVNLLDRIESQGLIPNNIDYNYLIKLFCIQDHVDKASHLLNIMLKKGNSPDSTSYSYLIQSYCNCHNLDSAMDVYSEMLCKRLKPCVKTLDFLVQNLCENGRVEEGEKVLEFMMESGEIPTRKMFCAIIDKYRAGNNSGKASELLKVMQKMGFEPDFETHWSVISKLTDSSKKDESRNPSFLSGLLAGFGFARKNP